MVAASLVQNPIVRLARTSAQLTAHLVGEAETLLRHRSCDGWTGRDLVHEAPHRLAGEQPVYELVREPAVEELRH